MIKMNIIFWQRIISPLVAELAVSLSRLGFNVTYVAEQELNIDRVKLGWVKYDLKNVEIKILTDISVVRRVVLDADPSSIHICQGIRGNGLIKHVQKVLRDKGLSYWVIFETVNDAGVKGILKRGLYNWLLYRYKKSITGILSIGWSTKTWLYHRGMAINDIYDFTYFLPKYQISNHVVDTGCKECLKIIYVGQLIERKRVDLLLLALSKLENMKYELIIIGDGNLKEVLRTLANNLVPNNVNWIGKVQMDEVSKWVENSDILVLPSRHDGWGAVVSEALMVGTPAICSDACGVAGVVKASGTGGVFPSGDVQALAKLLEEQLSKGKQSDENREKLANWAKCLGAEAGAMYLDSIFKYVEQGGERPVPPWVMRAK